MAERGFQEGEWVKVSIGPTKFLGVVRRVDREDRLIVELQPIRRTLVVSVSEVERTDERPPGVTRGNKRSLGKVNTPPIPSLPPRPRRTKSPTTQPREAQAVEALRYGLVPRSSVLDLTIGLPRLEKWIEKNLPDRNRGKPTLSEVAGPFGSGKSHTMDAVRAIAVNRNYVTARVEVDGSKVSLADPESFLEALWSKLNFGSLPSATPVLDLYTDAIKKGAGLPRITPERIDRIKDYYVIVKRIMDANLLDELGPCIDGVISSRKDETVTEVRSKLSRHHSIDLSFVSLRRMIGWPLDERPLDFVRALAGHALVAQSCGYQGLVITIDEFEVDRANLDGEKSKQVLKLLEMVRSYLCDELHFYAAPLAIFVASVGQEGHEGDRLLENLINRSQGAILELQPMQPHEYHELGEKIHAYYRKAYKIKGAARSSVIASALNDFDLENANLDSGGVRVFVKNLVAQCDATYGLCGHA